MADSFFGFNTSLSNLNDDEGGGEPSEDEYDALNDETFGQDSEEFDWEVEHEQLAEQLESSRRHNSYDDVNLQLEASLSQLVLDEPDTHMNLLGSSVWRHDYHIPKLAAPIPIKNVCTVEELERQMRQKQMATNNQSFYHPRYPVILQRPPGLQAPVPLPYAPQSQQLSSNLRDLNQPLNMRDLNQPLNSLLGPPQMSTLAQSNLLQNHLGQNINQIGQTVNQYMQSGNQGNQFQNSPLGQSSFGLGQNQYQNQMNPSVNQLIQNQMGQLGPDQGFHSQTSSLGQSLGMNQVNQIGQNVSQLNPSVNQITQNLMGPSVNQLNQQMNQIGQNASHLNQMSQNMNQMGQGLQIGQNMNQIGQSMGQMGQNINQMGQNVNQMGKNVNQMGQNANQMMSNSSMNQYSHMMGQPRMMAPPPGISMPRQSFNQNMSSSHNQNVGGSHNHNFRGVSSQSKQSESMNHMMLNQPHPSMLKSQPPSYQPNSYIKHNTSPPPKAKFHPKVDTKSNKPRVYNSSNSKTQSNLTSQNLVQMIQNTHPMLHNMNTSYHNASHHPMLNNRTFNNQFVNHHMFNQRHNGYYGSKGYRRHSLNGDDASVCSDVDEYAGLMTQREKQWLMNIQMLQLNTGTPYIHDFYYTVFLERKANKAKEGVKEAHKANQQNHPFYSGAVKQENHTRERHNSNRHNSTSEDANASRTYVPAQFENSLGKLQCGSVMAPRKIIDADVVPAETHAPSRAPSRASTTNPNEVPREVKRTKQLLLDIEALYLVLLRLEELNDPLAISNALILKEREEKQKVMEAAQRELEHDQLEDSNLFLKNIESIHRKPKQDSPKSETIDKRQVVNLAVCQKPPVKNLLDEDKEELIGKMFSGLLHSDRLSQMLTVRKGRMLVCRFLCRVSPSHTRVRTLWARVLRAVTSVARRDDGTLVSLAPHYRRYIQNTTGWSAVLESCSMLAEAFDPARTPYALTTSFTLSCVCVLLERAAILVNTPDATSNERQWSKFLKTLARALKNTTLTVAKPLHLMPEHRVMQHLKQLESRATIEILQRGKSATEFADVTKVDVQEQLVKHLC